ncbi:UDP-Glycosyltransferase/glycogen phosphorylase [Obba rivulosa]|uniref:UDP-Glycosyltransferase/glycogen phosphorylase n=1 Tax=Obba rivulosa TaxID=1052685 RepID=A0A8E2ARX9_9APHY|nr:UDP-Glycosyltransferase/glycogen phosphorylase [Obba rivulosa]
MFLAYKSWGHTRPLCNLSSRILKIKPVYITFFVMHHLSDRVRADLQRNFAANEEHLLKLIRSVRFLHFTNMAHTWLWSARVVGLRYNGSDPIDTRETDVHSEEAYPKLAAEEPVTCMHTNAQFDAISAPDVAFADFYALSPLRTVRNLSKKPTKMGGKADLCPKVKEEVAKTGRDLNEVAVQIIHGVDGKVVRVPGIPPMYDYECVPQEMPPLGAAGSMFMATYDCLTGADGVVFSTPEPLQPDAGGRWYAETNRASYSSSKGGETQKFLDSVMKSHREHSLVYWPFGCIFWPTDPTKLWAVLDILMEKKKTFIMSHASPFCAVSEPIQEKVKEYRLGLLSPWTSQQTILSHPTTSWFVTHAGLNVVLESLAEGVPMICWPFTADQPTNVVHLSDNLNIAYKLLEVRSGLGFKPIFRSGNAPIGTVEAVCVETSEVLDKTFGEDGATKRENARKMKEVFACCWDVAGSSEKDLHRLVSSFTSV